MARPRFKTTGSRREVSGELKRPVAETLPDACVCRVFVGLLVEQFVFDADS